MKEKGYLHIIVGQMFSGKSEETHKVVRRKRIAKKRVLVFKSIIDCRDNNVGENICVTHAGNIFKDVIAVSSAIGILKHIDLSNPPDDVTIEEGQFLREEFIDVVLYLIDVGINVCVNSLLSDFNANRFGYIHELMRHADEISYLKAVCVVCGKEAIYSQAKKSEIIESSSQIHVGSELEFEARCRNCFEYPPDYTNRINRISKIHKEINGNGKAKHPRENILINN